MWLYIQSCVKYFLFLIMNALDSAYNIICFLLDVWLSSDITATLYNKHLRWAIVHLQLDNL